MGDACPGGGPTGVEAAAELHDMFTEDLLPRYFPHLRVTLGRLTRDTLCQCVLKLVSATIWAFDLLQTLNHKTGFKYCTVWFAVEQMLECSADPTFRHELNPGLVQLSRPTLCVLNRRMCQSN